MLAVVCCFLLLFLFLVAVLCLFGFAGWCVLASLAFANIAVWSGCEVNLSDTMDFA